MWNNIFDFVTFSQVWRTRYVRKGSEWPGPVVCKWSLASSASSSWTPPPQTHDLLNFTLEYVSERKEPAEQLKYEGETNRTFPHLSLPYSRTENPDCVLFVDLFATERKYLFWMLALFVGQAGKELTLISELVISEKILFDDFWETSKLSKCQNL